MGHDKCQNHPDLYTLPRFGSRSNTSSRWFDSLTSLSNGITSATDLWFNRPKVNKTIEQKGFQLKSTPEIQSDQTLPIGRHQDEQCSPSNDNGEKGQTWTPLWRIVRVEIQIISILFTSGWGSALGKTLNPSLTLQSDRTTALMTRHKTADRANIPPFIVMDVMRSANKKEAAGERIIHMEVGQPSTKAPSKVIAAAHQALDTDRLGYTDAKGLPELRTRISRHYRDWYNLDISPHRIIVTTGSSAGFVLAFLALFDKGARVALPVPGYPCYPHILRALDINPVFIQTNETSRWSPQTSDLDNLAASESPVNGLLLASPNNPTGTMLDATALKKLVTHCTNKNISFISDEIYHGLTYGTPAPTALAYSSEAIVINSFSKYFSMTGWRIGWMVVPDHLARPIERLQQNLYINAPTLSQLAAIKAFDCHEELETFKTAYEKNRDFLLNELPGAGFGKLLPADGAFYLYADIGDLTDDSKEFTRRILKETGVALTPGLDFDAQRGHHFMRFSYARSLDDMQEAVKRLKAWNKKQ
jgi:aspartate/methionine/tyrosine aminotransferase